MINYEKSLNSISFDTEYVFEDETISGKLTITKDSIGNVTMISEEGEKNDIAIFKTNGDIILNGEKVIIEVTETCSPIALEESSNDLTRQRYNRWQTNCPYGMSRDYTTYYSTVEVNYAFAQIIAEISMNILIATIAERAIPGAQDNLTADVLEDMLADSLHQAVDYLEDTIPMGNAMSTATVRNVHNSLGAYNPSLGVYVYKAYVNIYAKRNCEGIYYVSGEVYNVIAT